MSTAPDLSPAPDRLLLAALADTGRDRRPIPRDPVLEPHPPEAAGVTGAVAVTADAGAPAATAMTVTIGAVEAVAAAGTGDNGYPILRIFQNFT